MITDVSRNKNIVSDYLGGMSFNDLSIKYSVSRRSIKNVLKSNKINSNRVTAQHDIGNIIKSYQDGLPIIDICKKYCIRKPVMFNILKKNNVVKRGRMDKSMTNRNKLIAEAYLSGLSSTDVGKKFKLKHGSVLKALEKSGIKRRKIGINKCRYVINHGAFANESPEMMYWLGFLMADGCVTNIPNLTHKQLCVQLQSRDVDHLKKFKYFLGSDSKISTYTRNSKTNKKFTYKSLRVGSNKIANDIEKYGIVPRKTFITEAKNGAENSIEFWLGMIDGDGCIYYNKKNNKFLLNLVGTKKILDQFRQFLVDSNFISTSDIRIPSVRKIKKCNSYSFSICCSKAAKFLKMAYNKCPIKLYRKYDKFLEYCKANNIEYSEAPNTVS